MTANTPPHVEDLAGQTVVLLHGLIRTSLSFLPMERHLHREGYRAIRWGYPSRRKRIEEHSEKLQVDLRQLEADPDVSGIHLVGHSLGGIIARHALNQVRLSKARRLITLASPNRGAHRATRYGSVLGWFARPLPQLADRPDSFVNQMSVPDAVEIGNVAARWDRKVRIDETHLDGEADHLIVGGTHTFIMCRQDVHAQVVAFLRTGRFKKADQSD